MKDKVEEIKEIWMTKVSEWTKQIDSLFQRDLDNQSELSLSKRKQRRLLKKLTKHI